MRVCSHSRTVFVLGFLSGCLVVSSTCAQQLDFLTAFELAHNNDPQYLEKKALRQSALEYRSQAIAALLPEIAAIGDSSWNYLRNKKVNFQSQGIQRFWSHIGEVSINQPILDISRWIKLDKSDYQIAKAEAILDQAYQDLIVRTATAYFNVLLQQETLRLTKAELEAQKQTKEQAQLRFKLGLAPVTALLEANAKYLQNSATIAESESALIEAESALVEIIGTAQNSHLVPLIEAFPLESPTPDDLDTWQTYALAGNRQLIAEMSEVMIAKTVIDSEKTGHYPTIEGYSSFAFQDNSSTFGQRGETGVIGVKVKLPIFSGGGINSKVRQAHYQHEASQHKMEVLKRSILRDVKNNYFTVFNAIRQIEALQGSVKNFESTVQATRQGLSAGTHTVVDVLDAQTDLYKAKRDLTEKKHRYLIAWLRLRLASGLLHQDDILKLNQYLLPVVSSS
ncbi:MAG: TolC family outer membrane protein [Gammaproteobacteria bacterium]|nr:TolC family outer membrane protein [Gammaproteobacteria bacterium]